MSSKKRSPRAQNNGSSPAGPAAISSDDPHAVATVLLARADPTLRLDTLTTIQTLWAGYGHICAISASRPTGKARGREQREQVQLILKLIVPPSYEQETCEPDEGHLRKMLSYEVEQYFYTHVSPTLPGDVGVARCLASTYADGDGGRGGVVATLLEDLRGRFPAAPGEGARRSSLSVPQVQAALAWLAKFHRATRAPPPGGLAACVLPPLEEVVRARTDAGRQRTRTVWLNGGYTYLATRRGELASLATDRHSEWREPFCGPAAVSGGGSSVAELAAAFLIPRGRPCETLIHGDVKTENLFSTAAGEAVAFFDFQYVGRGLGVCDLAKLFTCSVPSAMLAGRERVGDRGVPMLAGEERLLRAYLATLEEDGAGDGSGYEWPTFVRHWETALVDWCRFQASWGFWGNTAWLQARVRWILEEANGWRTWVENELAEAGIEL